MSFTFSTLTPQPFTFSRLSPQPFTFVSLLSQLFNFFSLPPLSLSPIFFRRFLHSQVFFLGLSFSPVFFCKLSLFQLLLITLFSGFQVAPVLSFSSGFYHLRSYSTSIRVFDFYKYLFSSIWLSLSLSGGCFLLRRLLFFTLSNLLLFPVKISPRE
jgi:hypothetical protein